MTDAVLPAELSRTLQWKLLGGSHEFPGPEGGTCINEAAIVAAGFKYKKVRTANDCPPCFSKPIAQFAIALNDAMSEEQRQALLMPFVLRLAGSADEPAVEAERAQHLLMGFANRLMPKLLRWLRLDRDAGLFELAPDRPSIELLCQMVALPMSAIFDRRGGRGHYAAAVAEILEAAAQRDPLLGFGVATLIAQALDYAGAVYAVQWVVPAPIVPASLCPLSAEASPYVEERFITNVDARREFFAEAVEILDGALKIGKQAEPIALQQAAERMEKARFEAKLKVGAE